MSRTVVFKVGWWTERYMVWPWPDRAHTPPDCDYPSYESLLSPLHFAEREFGSTKGNGNGPFFAATYLPANGLPDVSIGTSSILLLDTGLHLDKSENGVDWYTDVRRSWHNGTAAIIVASVQFANGRLRNEPACFIIKQQDISLSSWTRGLQLGWTGSYRPPYTAYTDPAEMCQFLISHAEKYFDYYRYGADVYCYVANYQIGQKQEVEAGKIPFKFGEYAFYTGSSHSDLTSPFSTWGHLHPGLFSAAYYAAQDKLPQLLQTTIQNIIDTGKLCVSLFNGIDLSDLKSIKRLAADSWLKYRYEYNTTISDLEELESALERFDNLSRMAGTLTSYGQRSDDTGNYHCALVISPEQILNRSLMKRLNLRPTLAGAWDMLPYSFIIDWFTDIGSVLHAIDQWLDAPSYGSVECWYSYTNTYKTEDGTVTVFFRYQGGRPLLPYWSMSLTSKNQVWGYRALDTISLLL